MKITPSSHHVVSVSPRTIETNDTMNNTEIKNAPCIKPELTTIDYGRYFGGYFHMPLTPEQKLNKDVMNAATLGTIPSLLKEHNFNDYGLKAMTVMAESCDINMLADVIRIADVLNKKQENGDEVTLDTLNDAINSVVPDIFCTKASKLKNIIIDCWDDGNKLFEELCNKADKDDVEDFTAVRNNRKEIMLKAWDNMQR